MTNNVHQILKEILLFLAPKLRKKIICCSEIPKSNLLKKRDDEKEKKDAIFVKMHLD